MLSIIGGVRVHSLVCCDAKFKKQGNITLLQTVKELNFNYRIIHLCILQYLQLGIVKFYINRLL